jgi:hypothetical protein
LLFVILYICLRLGLPTGHLYLGCPTKPHMRCSLARSSHVFYAIMLMTHMRYDGNSVPLCKIWTIDGRDWLITIGFGISWSRRT